MFPVQSIPCANNPGKFEQYCDVAGDPTTLAAQKAAGMCNHVSLLGVSLAALLARLMAHLTFLTCYLHRLHRSP